MVPQLSAFVGRPTRAVFASLLSLAGLGVIAALALAPAPALAAVPSPGQPFTFNYPRLGMWWPATASEPTTRVARYDWLVLGSYDLPRVPAIRAKNPAIVLLNSTNAFELAFDPFNWSANADLRRVPAQWMLQQVGSTLRSSVSAQTNKFPVTLTVGSGGMRLFEAGDPVVVDDEVAYVSAVSDADRTLTVVRGAVKAATSHNANARIAAGISYWPKCVFLNISSDCPNLTAEASVGPETWAMYNARRGAALVADPSWDGLLIDRADGDESWLVAEGAVRSIDSKRTNQVPASYSAFDAAWNAGLRTYLSRLRTLAGDRRVVITNLGYTNYDLLNGNNFEGFPYMGGWSDQMPWHETMFGPLPGHGGYSEWLAKSRQPNLTMVQTYENDESRDTVDTGGYVNPFKKPGFRPNYRRMRFGLTTALLGDGFFSYELCGHGSDGLMWFDEYDNAGAGRGYLGQPLGPARRAVGPPSTPNLVASPFDTSAQVSSWGTEVGAGYSLRASLDTAAKHAGAGSARLEVGGAKGVDWEATFRKNGVPVSAGEYTLSFWAKAASERPLSTYLQRPAAPWSVLVQFPSSRLTTSWQYFELSAGATGVDPAAILRFGLGEATATVWLDDVRLQRGSTEIWRRDYSGGVSIVNASASTRTIDLGEEFRKIRGTQDPVVNNGLLVRAVAIPPHDGIVLLRVQPNVSKSRSNLTAAASQWQRCADAAAAAEAASSGLGGRAGSVGPACGRLRLAAIAARDACLSASSAIQAGDLDLARARTDDAVTRARRANQLAAGLSRIAPRTTSRRIVSLARAAERATVAGASALR